MAECIEREAAIKAIYDSDPNGIRRTLGFNVGQIEEALRAVPAVSVPQWISVKDRLPCSGQPALVANSALRLVSIAWHDAGSGCWESPVWWFCENSPEITHWMPLPEPPKGDADNG